MSAPSDRLKDIFSLSFAAWEQVGKNPEEAKRLFKKIHSIASGGKYMMEHPDFYVKNDEPDEDVLDDEEEVLLNRLCDAIETECFGEDFDYSRGRMKKQLQKILDGVENEQ